MYVYLKKDNGLLKNIINQLRITKLSKWNNDFDVFYKKGEEIKEKAKALQA